MEKYDSTFDDLRNTLTALDSAQGVLDNNGVSLMIHWCNQHLGYDWASGAYNNGTINDTIVPLTITFNIDNVVS